jgi:serine/threonine protein kinase
MNLPWSVPGEIAAELDEMEKHYEDFSFNDRGANGFLIFAKNKLSQSCVAIKFYCGEPGDKRHEEPRRLSSANSPHVLSILDAKSISDSWAYFITPRCFDGDLDDLIKSRPSVHRAIDVSLAICSGVSAIHALKMLHRDLKPGNIVIDSGVPKIADFGSVRMIEEGENDVTASKHSVLFRPPESFSSGRYSMKGDIYQVGLVAYLLFGGKLSYDGLDYLSPKELSDYYGIYSVPDRSIFVDKIIQRRAESGRLMDFGSLPGWIDAASKGALRRATNADPTKRISSISDLASELTQFRRRIPDWRLDGDSGMLDSGRHKVLLRPIGDGNFEAFRDSGSGFRKIPKVTPAPLNKICKAILKL